jgi:hypothetical protein
MNWTFIRFASLVLALTLSSIALGQNKSSQEFKVNIESTELDRKQLLEKLNSNGSGHHMKFIQA